MKKNKIVCIILFYNSTIIYQLQNLKPKSIYKSNSYEMEKYF